MDAGGRLCLEQKIEGRRAQRAHLVAHANALHNYYFY